VRELRAEIGDELGVDTVAHLGEGVVDDLDGDRPDRCDAFAQLHDRYPLRSSRRRPPFDVSAGARSAANSSARARNALAGSDRLLASTMGSPALSHRTTSRWLGMSTSGARPRIATTSAWLIPTLGSARLSTTLTR